jgi:hypothetical protein
MMNYPIIIDNALPVRLFETLIDDLYSNWTFGVQNRTSKIAPQFWYRLETNTLLYFECGCYLKLKIQKFLKRKLQLVRINCNAQTSFLSSEFHKDFEDEDFFTVVLFTSPFWNTNWSGELIIRNEITKSYSYAPYHPNRAVLIPSNWPHRGESPNILTNELRTSVAFSYCPPEYIDNFYEGNPLVKFL